MKKLCLTLILCFTFLNCMYAKELESYLSIQPQVKIGKIENGNGFLELQYVKLDYFINEQFRLQGGVSTGFTSPRADVMSFNHYVNRVGIKATYQVNDRLGVFLEGNFASLISGANNPVSYFTEDTYQAFGASVRIFKMRLK